MLLESETRVRYRYGGIAKWISVGFGIVLLAALIWSFWLWRFFAPPPLNPPIDTAEFSRSDCLMRIDILYPSDRTYAEIEEIGAKMQLIFIDAIIEKRLPVATQGWGHADDCSHYTLFTQKCDRKNEMIAELVRAYEEAHPQGAQLTISPERIHPGIDTILMEGPWWTDGYEPVLK